MAKPQTYWQRYDCLYKNNSKKDIYRRLLQQSRKLGAPYKKRGTKGRKLKFSPATYACFLCLQKMFGNKYREMELEATLYLPKKADHATFARNYEKIPETYLEKLILSFVKKIHDYLIADSTAISTKIRVERIREGTRNKQKLADKLQIILGYDPPTSSTIITGVKATNWQVSDDKAAIEMLKNKNTKAKFFGDSAYNTYELHEKIRELGLIPVIKPDKRRVRK